MYVKASFWGSDPCSDEASSMSHANTTPTHSHRRHEAMPSRRVVSNSSISGPGLAIRANHQLHLVHVKGHQ